MFNGCRSIIDSREDYTLNYSRMTGKRSSRTISQSTVKSKEKKMSPGSKVNTEKVEAEKVKPIVTTKKKIPSRDKKIEKPADVVRRKIDPKSVRHQIAKYSKKFIGVKYKYGGKNPFGFDCSGFTYYTFKKYDILLPATAKDQSTFGTRIPLEAVNVGDLLFFDMDEGVGHVALVIKNDGNQLIMRHASSSSGVVDEDYYLSSYWQKRFLFAADVLLDK